MNELEEFTKTKLDIMQNLVGKKLKRIFKQLDFYVVGIGDEEYALHTYCFLRIRKGNELIMTSTDEYLLPDHNRMPNDMYESDELHEKSLLMLTLAKAKEMIGTALVKKVKISDIADISITFDNGVIIETFTDSLWQNNEFFRFFKYRCNDFPHYVVRYLDNKIVIEKV